MSPSTRSQKGKAAASGAPPVNAIAPPTSIPNPMNATVTSSSHAQPVPTGAAAHQPASHQPLQPIDTNIIPNIVPAAAAPNAPLGGPAAMPSLSNATPAATTATTSCSTTIPAAAVSLPTAVSTPAPATSSAPIQGGNGPINAPHGNTTTPEQHQGSTNDAAVVSLALLAPPAGSGNSSEDLCLEEEVQHLRALICAQRDKFEKALAAGNGPPPPPAAPAVHPENENAPIPRPRPLPGNPQTALGLENNRSLYLRCRQVVRSCINKVEESYLVNWHDQPDEFIAKVKSLAKAKCPHLGRYRNGWATELLMVLERDPDGEKRKAVAAARKARTPMASHDNSSNSIANDERNANEGDVTMQPAQPEAGPSNSDNGIDNLSELTEEERNEMMNDPLANEEDEEEEEEAVAVAQPQHR